MNKKLEKEIKTIQKSCQDQINTLYLREELQNKLSILFNDRLKLYSNCIILNFSFSDIEDIEINIIPKLSELVGCKWTKRVSEGDIEYKFYESSKYGRKFSAIIYTYLTSEDSCHIKKIPTGRVVGVAKLIEEPEYEYLIDCGEKND